jgi:hypothetical protein
VTQAGIQKEVDIFRKKGIEVLLFSAVTGEGVNEVLGAITKKLHSHEMMIEP